MFARNQKCPMEIAIQSILVLTRGLKRIFLMSCYFLKGTESASMSI